jgi:hypothetical protein
MPSPTPKRIRGYKVTIVFVALIPLIDLGSLLLGLRLPDPREPLFGSLFVIAGGGLACMGSEVLPDWLT